MASEDTHNGLAHGTAATASAAAPASWMDRLLALRDRTVAKRSFQRAVASNPFTRFIARRKSRDLFDLVAGFVYSQVLLACVQLKLFDLLIESPLTLEQIAARTGLPLDGARRLVDAAVALRLFERRSGGRIGLGELGAPMVGNEAVGTMVEHHVALYADLSDPVRLFRGERGEGDLARYWPYAAANPGQPAALDAERVAAYSALMSASQPLVTDEIFSVYDLGQHRRLLDVGGGEGRFVRAVAARYPKLDLTLFDLPAVAARARVQNELHGLGGRIATCGGSFLDDELPRGADIATLVRVIFDHPDERAMHILRAVHRALPAGGTLLLAEPLSGTPGAERMGDAYFGVYLLAMGRGRARTFDAMASLLTQAGFTGVRKLHTDMPLHTAVILATVHDKT